MSTKKSTKQKRLPYRSPLLLRSMFLRFFSLEATGGILLLVFMLLSIAIANIPALGCVSSFFNTEFSIKLGDYFNLSMSLTHWINDGLMVIFFFVVGLEIKRELLVGELSSVRHASLPIMAAIGGMVVPAIIYAFFNQSGTGQAANGWGIPMATDIAFAIGILSLLGKRVPLSLKIFLTALAIVDDLGAIVVIAIFYPVHSLHAEMLLMVGAIMLLMSIINFLRIRYTIVYIVAGVLLWLAVLESGLHATIAGVLLAMVVPASARSQPVRFFHRCRRMLNEFMQVNRDNTKIIANQRQKELVHSLQNELNNVVPPLQRFEYVLHPWVMYAIMPLFALVNAGVRIDSAAIGGLTSSVSLGVFFGLLLGKPLGIILFSWLAVKSKLAHMPNGIGWGQLSGVGIMAGIGFTMSVFIANLAFTDEALVSTAKLAILITSTTAGVLGALVVRATTSKRAA